MAELKNEFSWSKSRDDAFRRCPRQYYYAYYGFWGGWEKRADPRVRTLYVLKNLVGRAMWAGQVVHKCIHWILDTLRRDGAAPALEDAVRNTLRRMNKDFQDSGEGLYWDDPKRIVGLREHEYEEDVDDDEWQRVMEHAANCVTRFYESEVFSLLSKDSTDRWLALESLSSFRLEDVKVYVQPDFARKTDDGLTIYDWKTGKADKPSTREQLACYAFYATKQWSAAPTDVTTAELNLGTGTLIERKMTADDLKAAETTIRDSIQGMRALLDDVPTNLATEDHFPLATDEKPCRLCNFRCLCPRFAEADA